MDGSEKNGANRFKDILIVVNLVIILGGGSWSVTGINSRISSQELRLAEVERALANHTTRLAVKHEKIDRLEEAIKKCEALITRRRNRE